jgi:hypothetical protein
MRRRGPCRPRPGLRPSRLQGRRTGGCPCLPGLRLDRRPRAGTPLRGWAWPGEPCRGGRLCGTRTLSRAGRPHLDPRNAPAATRQKIASLAVIEGRAVPAWVLGRRPRGPGSGSPPPCTGIIRTGGVSEMLTQRGVRPAGARGVLSHALGRLGVLQTGEGPAHRAEAVQIEVAVPSHPGDPRTRPIHRDHQAVHEYRRDRRWSGVRVDLAEGRCPRAGCLRHSDPARSG